MPKHSRWFIITPMDTEKRFGLRKGHAVLLFIQMLLTLIIVVAAMYLLIFVSANSLGGWMIASYICITLSALSIVAYGVIGYKEGDLGFKAIILPFLAAIFVNILLPNRSAFQVGTLTILFAFTFALMASHDAKKLDYALLLGMVVASLAFSIYSAITADTQFLGPVSEQWFTYVSMYLSIFVPTIMSFTLGIVYRVNASK